MSCGSDVYDLTPRAGCHVDLMSDDTMYSNLVPVTSHHVTSHQGLDVMYCDLVSSQVVPLAEGFATQRTWEVLLFEVDLSHMSKQLHKRLVAVGARAASGPAPL